MSSRMKLVHLDPNNIKIPPVRVTSMWDPEDYEIFKASLEADGQGQAIICVKEGDVYWLADGLHRLEEAKLKGWPKIAVAYKEGSLVDAKVRNLYMNRLRGKTKASEEVTLIKDLFENDGLDLAEVSKRTGIPMELVEKRLAVGRADPYVQEMLDHERIGVGIAFELSRLPNPAGQVRLLQELVKMPRLPETKDVKAIVEESLRIIAEQAQTQDTPAIGPPLRTIKCFLDEERHELNDVRGINVCLTCLGLAKDYIQELKKKRARAETPEQILAQRVADASKIGGPPP